MCKYRNNVAAFVLNHRGRILICQRSDEFKTWQLPQGGIDKGESEVEALLRELQEEIGTNDVHIIHKLEEKIRYDWPKHLHNKNHIGQEQTFFLVKLNNKVDLQKASTKEFGQVKWIDAENFKKLDSGFKTEAYQKALTKMLELFPGLFLL